MEVDWMFNNSRNRASSARRERNRLFVESSHDSNTFSQREINILWRRINLSAGAFTDSGDIVVSTSVENKIFRKHYHVSGGSIPADVSATCYLLLSSVKFVARNILPLLLSPTKSFETFFRISNTFRLMALEPIDPSFRGFCLEFRRKIRIAIRRFFFFSPLSQKIDKRKSFPWEDSIYLLTSISFVHTDAEHQFAGKFQFQFFIFNNEIRRCSSSRFRAASSSF